LRTTFLPHFFFSQNLCLELLSSLVATMSVVETLLVNKITHLFIFCGWFLVGSDFVQLHLCIEVSFLNFYFVHIQSVLVFGKLNNVSFIANGFFEMVMSVSWGWLCASSAPSRYELYILMGYAIYLHRSPLWDCHMCFMMIASIITFFKKTKKIYIKC